MNKPICAIIPAFNEEKAIAKVIREIPHELVQQIIVVDNNSTDRTCENAEKAGATVVKESRSGYGYACLKGIDFLKMHEPTEYVVFLDGDYADYPKEMARLYENAVEQNLDLVIGSRALGQKERGALTPQQIFGNWLATRLIALLYKVKYTDLGPFRLIKWETLLNLNMEDKTYGWTVEMQLKAAKLGCNIGEIPVKYRKRIGESKVSGTLKGTVLAGYKILSWIFKYR